MTGNTADQRFRCLPNNVSNLCNTSTLQDASAFSNVDTVIRLTENQHTRLNANNAWALSFNNYTSATRYKPFNFYGFYVDSTTTDRSIIGAGAFRSNTAITSLVFDYDGTRTFASGTVLLYGVK
jgi:hypothetical protein